MKTFLCCQEVQTPRNKVMSHIMRKCDFGDFRPGMTQTGLLSYSD